jgi:hypothetical protein
VCTVKNSWWWTEELFETCTVLFQNKFWEISASSWAYCKDFCWKVGIHLLDETASYHRRPVLMQTATRL